MSSALHLRLASKRAHLRPVGATAGHDDARLTRIQAAISVARAGGPAAKLGPADRHDARRLAVQQFGAAASETLRPTPVERPSDGVAAPRLLAGNGAHFVDADAIARFDVAPLAALVLLCRRIAAARTGDRDRSRRGRRQQPATGRRLADGPGQTIEPLAFHGVLL